MVFSVEPMKGIWQVLRSGELVISADYRLVEDWLDWAENSLGCIQQDNARNNDSGRTLPTSGNGNARSSPKSMMRAGKFGAPSVRLAKRL